MTRLLLCSVKQIATIQSVDLYLSLPDHCKDWSPALSVMMSVHTICVRYPSSFKMMFKQRSLCSAKVNICLAKVHFTHYLLQSIIFSQVLTVITSDKSESIFNNKDRWVRYIRAQERAFPSVDVLED